MTQQTTTDRFQKEIHTFLEETFDKVHGIYLDKGTSFLETLEGVSKANVKLVMTPPWTPERMTDDARDALGIF